MIFARATHGYVVYTQDATRSAYILYVAPFLRVQVNGRFVSGLAAPNQTVTVTLDTPGGSTGTYYQSDSLGRFGPHDYYEYYPYPGLAPGQTVRAATAGQAFSMTVQDLSARASLAQNLVYGHSPVGLPLEIAVYPGPLAHAPSRSPWDATPRAHELITPTGHYSVPISLQPADFGAALVTTADGNQTLARFAVPYLNIPVGSSPAVDYPYYKYSGQVDDQNTAVTISVLGPSQYLKIRRSLSADSIGLLTGSSKDNVIPYVVIESGDVITLETPARLQSAFQVPPLTVQVDPDNDTISGQALPGALVTLHWFDYGDKYVPPYPPPYPDPGSNDYQYTHVVTASSTGAYSATLTAYGDLSVNAYGEASMIIPAGHRIFRSFRATSYCPPRPINIHVGSNTLFLSADASCHSATVRLLDSSGKIKAEQATSGYDLAVTFRDTNWAPVPILPGDRLEIIANGEVSSLSIPTFSTALDLQPPHIHGYAPPGAVIGLRYQPEYQFASPWWLEVSANAAGSYSLTLPVDPNLTLRPGDTVVASLITNAADFHTMGGLPVLRTGSVSQCNAGWLPPLTYYTFTHVFASGTQNTLNGYADGNDGSLPMCTGTASSGDTLILTSTQGVRRLLIPPLSARIDPALARVSGIAPALSNLRISLERGNDGDLGVFYPGETQYITTTIGGIFAADFPELAPLTRAQGELTYFDETGDQAVLNFFTPHWRVRLNETHLDGTAARAGVTLTITLNSPARGISETIQTWSSAYNGMFFAWFQSSFQPGDELTIRDSFHTDRYTLPHLAVRHDFSRRVIEGTAPPGSLVSVIFPGLDLPWYNASLVRQVKATPAGSFGLDVSDLNLPVHFRGYIGVSDVQGNITELPFRVEGLPAYLPIIGR